MSRETRREVIYLRIKLVKNFEKELQKICIAQSKLGYIILDKPIKDGWYRTFRLRDDILRNKKHKIYQEVLNAVVVAIRGSNKKNANKRWEGYFKNTCRIFQRPGIKRLNEKEYSEISSQAKKCFIGIKYKTYKGYRNRYSCILPRYYFQIAYKRAYITKRRITSSLLQSREKEIMEILNHPELRQYSIYYNYNYRTYDNPVKKERRKSKQLLLINQYEPYRQLYQRQL